MSKQALRKVEVEASQEQRLPRLAPSGLSKSPITAVFESVLPGLQLVESRMDNLLGSDAEALTEISRYLMRTGGKRIRPVLVLLVAKLFGMDRPDSKVVDVASGIELIHMATLLHDDIIDQSPTRRHLASAYRRFGLNASLLTGDFLLVKAFGLCATLGEFVVKATESACVELTEGEVLEGRLDGTNEVSIESYTTVVGKKTASLFALASRMGAHLAGESAEVVGHAGWFGHSAGIAFQIVDDILDIVADEDLLGKPVGTDLRQKTPSLVNVLWLASGDIRAKEFFSIPSPSEQEARQAAEFLKGSPIVERCREQAIGFSRSARQSLDSATIGAHDGTTKHNLLTILDYTLERCL